MKTVTLFHLVFLHVVRMNEHRNVHACKHNTIVGYGASGSDRMKHGWARYLINIRAGQEYFVLKYICT